MEKKTSIDNIINSLDGLQKASPGDFFITRVQARLQKEEMGFWGTISAYVSKRNVALATLCLIFLLNAAAMFYQHNSSKAAMADQVEQNMGDEYNTTLASNSYYDDNSEAH